MRTASQHQRPARVVLRAPLADPPSPSRPGCANLTPSAASGDRAQHGTQLAALAERQRLPAHQRRAGLPLLERPARRPRARVHLERPALEQKVEENLTPRSSTPHARHSPVYSFRARFPRALPSRLPARVPELPRGSYPRVLTARCVATVQRLVAELRRLPGCLSHLGTSFFCFPLRARSVVGKGKGIQLVHWADTRPTALGSHSRTGLCSSLLGVRGR
jgi:hypothetical protein